MLVTVAVVVEILHHNRRQKIELYCSKMRLNMLPNNDLINFKGSRFYIQQIATIPNIKPFADRHIGWWNIATFIKLMRKLLELFGYFSLRFACNGALDLFSRTGIETLGIARLPVCI